MKRPSRTLLWPIAAAVLFLASVFHLSDVYHSSPDLSPPAVRVADLLSTSSLAVGTMRTGTQYPQIAERPLFSRSRRPFAPPQQELAAPPPEPEPVAALNEPQITLQGVLINGETRRALVFASGEQAPRWLSDGEIVGGWTIIGISDNGIRLAAQGEKRTVNLYVEKSAAQDNLQ